MKLLENLLGTYLIALYSESKRVVQLKSLIVLVELTKGVRKLFLLYYLSVIFFTLSISGIFIVVVQGLNQYQKMNGIHLDPAIIFGAVLALVSISLSVWCLSERRFINALKLDTLIRQTLIKKEREQAQEPTKETTKETAKEAAKNQSSITTEDLKALINELVKKQLQVHLHEIAASKDHGNQKETLNAA